MHLRLGFHCLDRESSSRAARPAGFRHPLPRVKSSVSESRRGVLVKQGRLLVVALRENDEAAVEAAIVALSRSRRIFAPLVFTVGAFAMLFQGLRLLFSNWRLTLLQLLPATWIWLALLDLKVHVFKGKEFRNWHGHQ